MAKKSKEKKKVTVVVTEDDSYKEELKKLMEEKLEIEGPLMHEDLLQYNTAVGFAEALKEMGKKPGFEIDVML